MTFGYMGSLILILQLISKEYIFIINVLFDIFYKCFIVFIVEIFYLFD